MMVADIIVKIFVLVGLLGGVGFALIIWLNRREAAVTDRRYDHNFCPRQALASFQASVKTKIAEKLREPVRHNSEVEERISTEERFPARAITETATVGTSGGELVS